MHWVIVGVGIWTIRPTDTPNSELQECGVRPYIRRLTIITNSAGGRTGFAWHRLTSEVRSAPL
jgi:hypothetical protein